MNEATFLAEWTRVIDEDRAMERLVLKKMREMKLDAEADAEAKRRIAVEAAREAQVVAKMAAMHVDRRTAYLYLAQDALVRARAAMEDGAVMPFYHHPGPREG